MKSFYKGVYRTFTDTHCKRKIRGWEPSLMIEGHRLISACLKDEMWEEVEAVRDMKHIPSHWGVRRGLYRKKTMQGPKAQRVAWGNDDNVEIFRSRWCHVS